MTRTLQALHTGMVRQAKCLRCGRLITERQVHISKLGTNVWVMDPHDAHQGTAGITGSTACTERHAERCSLCRTLPRARRQPRTRTKSEVTASPILGQLSAHELIVLNAALYLGCVWQLMSQGEVRWFWVMTKDIKRQACLRDATTRDTLRRLAARGMLIQHPRSKKWRVNLPAKLRSPAESTPA